MQETEIKLAVASAAAARRLLRRAGFRVVRRRGFESNVVFDTARRALRKRGELLRLREVRGETILTFKGAAAAGSHKSRNEEEILIPDSTRFRDILLRLGYQPVFRYEKYRTEYGKAGQKGVVTLDETPIGVFLELEGSPAWIDRTAASLGFVVSDYITMSYGGLFLAYCQRNSTLPRDMVFRSPLSQYRY